MPDIMPFKRSSQLINEIDEYLDCCGEVALILEAAVLHYFDSGADDQLQARVDQVMSLEEKADTLRRGVANAMYAEMLMPDTRGDVLDLLDAVDGILDDTVHLLIKLAIERPDIPAELREYDRALLNEVAKAIQAMLVAARTYFRDPLAVRGEIHKISFHDKEATNIGLKVGRQIFDMDLPLDRKMQLTNFLTALRALASDADDVGDRLAIFAVKRLD